MKRLLLLFSLCALCAFERVAHAKTYAVVVGVRQEMAPLNFTMEDARLVRRTLEGDASNISLLVSDAPARSGQPTMNNVLGAIKAMAARTAPDDLFFLYFSGHGMAQGGKSFLVPQDCNGIDNFLDVSEIRKNLNNPKFCAAKTKILILDSCQSGSTKGLGQLSWQNLTPQKGIVTMAGCALNESSIESPQLQHGLFTYFLVRGMAGAASPGKAITLDSLRTYVCRSVPEFAVKCGGASRQTPQFLMQAGDGGAVVGQQNPQLLAQVPLPQPAPVEARVPLKPGVLVSFVGDGADTVSNEIGRGLTAASYPVVSGEKLGQFTQVLNTNDAAAQTIARFHSRFLLRGTVATEQRELPAELGGLISVQVTINAQLIDADGQIIGEISSDDDKGNPMVASGSTPFTARAHALRGASERLKQALLPFVAQVLTEQ